MSLVRTDRLSHQSGELAGVVTTPTFTPSNNSLLVVAAVGTSDSGTQLRASEMSIADSLGTLTWKRQVYGDTGGGGTFSPLCVIWTTEIGTGASMSVTVGSGGSGHTLHGAVITVVDYTGYDTEQPCGVRCAGTLADDGAVSLTLPALPHSTSEMLGLLGHGVGGIGTVTASPGSGWTEVYDLTFTNNTGAELQALVGLASTTVPWADSDQGGDGCYDTNAVALEIREAGHNLTSISSDYTDIAGLSIYLDFDDSGTVTTSGAEITQIDDKSGNAHDLIPIVGGSGPDLNAGVLNGKDVAQWNATNTGLRIDGLGFFQPLTIFVVLNVNSSAIAYNDIAYIFDSTGHGGFAYHGVNWHPVNSGSIILDGGSGLSFPANTFEIDEDSDHYVTAVLDHDDGLANLDGVNQFTGVAIGNEDLHLQVPFGGGMTLGRANGDDKGLGNAPGSYVGLLLVFARHLTDDEISAVETQINATWFGPSHMIYGTLTTEFVPGGGGGGTNTPKSVSGTITPSGAETRETSKVLAGALTPAGAETRATSKPLAGALTPSGALQKTINKALAGTLIPSGILTRNTSEVSTSGFVTPTGALTRAISKLLAGALTPTGAAAKNATKNLSGGLTPSGALARATTFARTLTGTINSAGSITKAASKLASGSVAPSSTETRNTQKSFSGGLTPSGSVSTASSQSASLAGTITPGSTLTRSISKLLAGTLTPSGEVARSTAKSLAGTIGPTGALSRSLSRLLAGSVGTQGSLVREVGKATTGSLGPSGSEVRLTSKLLDGTLGPAGSLQAQSGNAVSSGGNLAPSGSLTVSIAKSLAGTVTPAGSVTKNVSKTKSGVILPTGDTDTTSAQSVALAGAIGTAGLLVKRVAKSLAGEITPTGDVQTIFNPFQPDQHTGYARVDVTQSTARTKVRSNPTSTTVTVSSARVEVS